MPRFVAALPLALLLLAAAGCSQMQVKTSSQITAEGKRPQAAVKPSAVMVLESPPGEGSYSEIARIRAVGRREVDRGELVEALRIRAARLGANAITALEFGTEAVRGGAGGGMVCPFGEPCRYQETDSTVVGMPTADCTAIWLHEQ